MARFIGLNSFTSGRATITTSGTPVQLDANVIPPGVKLVIKAAQLNSGVVHVGNSSANANSSTSTVSYRLQPNEGLELEVQNSNAVWVDSTVSGDIVEFVLER